MLAKKILLAIFLSACVLTVSWYVRNQTVKNIVSGVISDPSSVLNSYEGNTNILLLGIGGAGHEGSDLTDSMLVLSLNLKNNTGTTISIPRDIWVPSLKAKINTAYHYGNERRDGGGRDLAKSAVSEVLGVPIHYLLLVDFSGFVKAIDSVGGIDLTIDNTFDDYKYPIPGKETVEPESDRYEHIHFEAGRTHLDGATALKFARSRYAQGEEGTDFARGQRQQKIILAFRDKLFSAGTLFNTEIIERLKSNLSSSIDTDITSVEQGSFIKLALSLGNQDNISSIVLTDHLKNPKSTREYGGQWVLIPTTTQEDLHTYVKANLAK